LFAADVVDTGGILSSVSLTLMTNLPPVSTTLAKLVAKFAASVVDTSGAPRLSNISANFQKKLKRSYWDTLGLGRKRIHEKNQKQQIL
jgi:hypothetical protein